MTNLLTTTHLTSTCPRCGVGSLVSVETSRPPRYDISCIIPEHAARAGERDSVLLDGPSQLIAHIDTPLGVLTVERSVRACSVIYDLLVAEANTGEEIQRAQIVCKSCDYPVRRILTLLDEERHLVFGEHDAGHL